MKSSEEVDYDVVVVGAGLSGLTASRRFCNAGAKTLCLEARDRVGGRAFTKEIQIKGQKVKVELGGNEYFN